MFRVLCLSLLVLVSLGLGACSSYQRRWAAAARTAPGGNAVEGSYAGTWQSDRGEFGGKLWCIVERAAAAEETRAKRVYRAQFRATWHGVFVSEHDVLLHAQPVRGGGVKFAGRAEIKMWIGSGSYDCAGEIRKGVLNARYDAHYDRGIFRMKRVGKNGKDEDEQGRHSVHR